MELLNDLSRILVSEEQIKERIERLGQEITQFYKEQQIEEITLICVTNGAILFASDLLRKLDIQTRLDCIRVTCTRDESRPVTDPEIIDNIRINIASRHVLLVDDVLYTGGTLEKIANILRAMESASLTTCVMLEKPSPRSHDLDADYVGFYIPNEFVVGYGLDFAERYRNLPCIGTLRSELQNPPEWC